MRLHAQGPQTRASNSAPGAIPGEAAVWATWKRWFDDWETNAARIAESALRQPWLLEPAGAVLTAALRAKIMSDRVTDAWLGVLGLSSRREQLRLRHEINALHSRLLDLQERLEAGDGGGVP